MGRLAVLCLALMATLSISTSAVKAEETFGQLSLFNPVQLFDEGYVVNGVRFNILYGVSEEVYGLDLGLVNKTYGDQKGIQWGLVNNVGGSFTGWQAAGVNIVEGDFLGWQSGWVNITQGASKGLQSGLYNTSGHHSGVQFGIFNRADFLDGLQIGLLNFNESHEPYGFLPLVNFSF